MDSGLVSWLSKLNTYWKRLLFHSPCPLIPVRHWQQGYQVRLHRLCLCTTGNHSHPKLSGLSYALPCLKTTLVYRHVRKCRIITRGKRHRWVLNARGVKWERLDGVLVNSMLCAPWPTLPDHSSTRRAPGNASSVIQTSTVRLLLLPNLGFSASQWFGLPSSSLQGFHQPWASAFQMQDKLNDALRRTEWRENLRQITHEQFLMTALRRTSEEEIYQDKTLEIFSGVCSSKISLQPKNQWWAHWVLDFPHDDISVKVTEVLQLKVPKRQGSLFLRWVHNRIFKFVKFLFSNRGRKSSLGFKNHFMKTEICFENSGI